MESSNYAVRLASAPWKEFAKKCRDHGGNICHMCGSIHEIHCHHMRYGRLGTHDEWMDIVLLCEGCHGTYHEKTQWMPRNPRQRLALLNELSMVLIRAGRDPALFLSQGDAMNEAWLAQRVVCYGLMDAPSRGKAKQAKRKRDPHAKMVKRTVWRWTPNTSQFTERQARCFVADPEAPVFNSPEFLKKFQIGESRPKNWRKYLCEALRLKFNIL